MRIITLYNDIEKIEDLDMSFNVDNDYNVDLVVMIYCNQEEFNENFANINELTDWEYCSEYVNQNFHKYYNPDNKNIFDVFMVSPSSDNYIINIEKYYTADEDKWQEMNERDDN